MKLTIERKVVGYWQLGGPQGLQIYMPRRPRWLTRRLASWLLEFEWRELL